MTAPFLQEPLQPAGSVHYTPRDCALLVGPSDVLLRHLEAVRLVGLRPALLCTDLPDMERLPRGIRALGGRPARITGWMGAFRATLESARADADLGPLSYHDDGHFDWVIDFSGFVPAEIPPPGWYDLAGADYTELKRALLEIARRLREGYDKPRYFRLNQDLCAHGRQGVTGCSACLQVCPAGAISSGKQSVHIEPHLCQGCGTCALVCPSGAVRHVQPGTDAELRRLVSLMDDKPVTTGIWIVQPGREGEVPVDWLAFPLKEPASLGVEFWLTALVRGAHRVAIATVGLPEATRSALIEQVAWANRLLAGLGYPKAIGLADTDQDLENLAAMPSLPPVDMPGGDDKRILLLAAVEALSSTVQAPIEIALPDGPLGTVAVSADKCTLCAVCVRLCPTGALHLPGSTSQLAFREDKCVQCNLCVNGCPEKALSTTPRLLTARGARETPRVLMQVEMVACAGCGAYFTNRAMLERSRALMADHPMFQGENAALMELCPNCRQRAMLLKQSHPM